MGYSIELGVDPFQMTIVIVLGGYSRVIAS